MKSIVAPLVALVASFAVALHGCGGDSITVNGSGAVTGNVGGAPFTVRDAITASTLLFNQTVSVVILTDISGACAVAKANANVKNSGVIGLGLWNNDGNGHLTPVTTPGTYTLDDVNDPNFPTSGKVGFGTVVKTDATCKDTSVSFKSGTVVISAVDTAGGLTGTFDGMTAENIHLTGTFASAFCVVPATDAGSPACN
jgi:hypothetical protein